MRPGKPLMFGTLGALPVLGLPGNPVSALVCGLLFLLPALRAPRRPAGRGTGAGAGAARRGDGAERPPRGLRARAA